MLGNFAIEKFNEDAALVFDEMPVLVIAFCRSLHKHFKIKCRIEVP